MEVTIDNIQYELDSLNNTASVIQSEYAGDVVIPAQIHVDGSIYTVNSIENYAFDDCSSLTSVSIPNSVTFIGKGAFYGCSSLTSITIPNSITTIGGHAFLGCSSLSVINIPNSVTFIGPHAFDTSHITSIKVEATNTIYDSRDNCNAIIETATNTLTIGCPNTIIPNSITTIGDYAFDGCTSLANIIIPHSVTKIGEFAFSDCPSLASIKVETGNAIYDSREDCNAIIETATNTLVFGCKNTFIPNNVTSIGDYAFGGCTSLTSISIPNSVTKIGKRAFHECSSLTSISIPDSIISIGGGAFENSGIYNDKSNWEEGVLYISNYLIATNENLCGRYAIKDNTRFIGDYAFQYCSDLTSITIPDSVINIGEAAFNECTSLETITLPDNLTYLGDYAFSECSSLENISIPNTITSVRNGTFSGCSSLKTIVLPNSVTSIGEGAFSECLFLLNITMPNSLNYIGKDAFYGCISLNSIIIPDNVTIISEGTFSGCSSLAFIMMPNRVITIGSEAFKECTSLTSILIPDTVKTIGKNAFSKCSKLISITIPHSVIIIENNAFQGCKSLDSIKVEIENAIYDSREDCNAIIETATNTLITSCPNTIIPSGVTKIGDYAFYKSPIASIAIPNSVTSIGEGAFWGCSRLASLTLPNGITNIEGGTFQQCTSLTSITLPNSVKNIAYSALLATSSLREICIPTGQIARFQQMEGLQRHQHLLKACDTEDVIALMDLAEAYLLGKGVTQDIDQAAQYYIQAADNGCAEAAYILAEWYTEGKYLAKNVNKALHYYQLATKAFIDAQNKSQQPKGKYLFFDTECNGLPKNYKLDVTAINNWPRLIQLAWIITDEYGNELKRKSHIVYPCDFIIDTVVADLTGITTTRAQQEGVDLTVALSEFMEDIRNVEIIIGHNINFDRHVVGCELYRTIGRHNTLMNKAYICTMQSSVNYCAIPSDNPYSNYKWPRLEELYRKLFGHMFDNAHDALADVSATKECYFELKKRGIL